MKVGIFFGGQSREREVSFAGGRTVFDNLDKNLFEAQAIFVDSQGNFILLNWEYLYKGTIRDFYPPAAHHLKNNQISPYQIYQESLGELEEEELDEMIQGLGKRIYPHQFKEYFDFAFLVLHGPFGEDGNIQGILEWQGIPYSGSAVLASALGVNKIAQSSILKNAGFKRPKQKTITREEFYAQDYQSLFQDLTLGLGLPLVIKAPNQGSSIGVSILEEADAEQFRRLCEKAFFNLKVSPLEWLEKSDFEKQQWLIKFTDIREGLGFPVRVHSTALGATQTLYHPSDLEAFLNTYSAEHSEDLHLEAHSGENELLFESFIQGREFSCIVIQDEKGTLLALPPTEILKYQELYDYRSKYLPGTSRKITPIEVDSEVILKIQEQCKALFKTIQAQVYARIDGFLSVDHEIYLNDPNTTSGMMPASFFFHQAAEIGLNASEFLTFLIHSSLHQRSQGIKNPLFAEELKSNLDQKLLSLQQGKVEKIRVAVIMGGFSTERHISMESGRNIYEKLASSPKYAPFPVFLTGDEKQTRLYRLPINYMLKDNADDVKEKIEQVLQDSRADAGELLLADIREKARKVTQKFAANPIAKPQELSFAELAEEAEVVFIALHGRPGEDGALQSELEKVGLAYNGSGVQSSQITINKFETNEILQKAGLSVAKHHLAFVQNWKDREEDFAQEIETKFDYPLIAKPADDGCSSAVKKIKSRAELLAFTRMMFREQAEFLTQESKTLGLKRNEEFPQKTYFLIEELIEPKGADHFLEITGGLLTHYKEGEIQYEIFEPSEALAQGEVLSLEEKFLAGEGQNITPARYHPEKASNKAISQKIRQELEKVARVLNIEGYARIDAFVRIWENQRVEVIIIEVNSLPGMTPATCIFHQCALEDYKPYQFIDAILEYGRARSRQNQINEVPQ